MKAASLLVLSTVLSIVAGCGATVKMAYVDAGGRHGSGAVTMDGSLHNGSFSITSSGQTCSGSFHDWSNLVLVVPVKCTDGDEGTATLTRPLNGPISGEGSLQLNAGGSRRFVYSLIGSP
jgi:hypothetical protein